jgi:ABC-type transport system involved in multi-copper enzyme maturation permease subunit
MDRGRLNRVVTVAANTFRETVREKVLYNLVFFAIIMTLSGLLLRDLTVRQDVKIIKDIGLASMDLFGTLMALFLGVGLVRKEIERRSLYPLLAKPLSRSEFLVGKFAGLGFTLLVNVGVMTAGLYLTLFATHHPFDPSLLKAILPLSLGLLVVVAIALLFSTLTSSALAAVGTLGVVLAGRFADVLRNLREETSGYPGWLGRTIYYAIPNFRNFDLKDRVVQGDPVLPAQLVAIGLYAFCYIGFLLTATLIVFRNKDLE